MREHSLRPHPTLRRWFVWLFLALFAGLYTFSHLLYELRAEDKPYILLFPTANSSYHDGGSFSHLYAEVRSLPKPQQLPIRFAGGASNQERRLYYLVKELSYGPDRIRSYPFLPVDIELKSLSIEGNTAYLHFGSSLLIGKSEHYFQAEARLGLIRKVIQLNFPELKYIYISTDSSTE